MAARGALLFFLMLLLQKVDPNYVYSLNAFVSIFSRALALGPKFEGAARFGGGGAGAAASPSKKKGGGGGNGLGALASKVAAAPIGLTNNGGGSKSPSSSLLSRFKAAVTKVICTVRFKWNVDQLREARLPASVLSNKDDGSLEAASTSASAALSAKLRTVDEGFRKKIQERCKELLQRISLSCFQCVARRGVAWRGVA